MEKLSHAIEEVFKLGSKNILDVKRKRKEERRKIEDYKKYIEFILESRKQL